MEINILTIYKMENIIIISYRRHENGEKKLANKQKTRTRIATA